MSGANAVLWEGSITRTTERGRRGGQIGEGLEIPSASALVATFGNRTAVRNAAVPMQHVDGDAASIGRARNAALRQYPQLRPLDAMIETLSDEAG